MLPVGDWQIENLYSGPSALSSSSLTASAADLGISGITHFTLPALISSWAMRQGLRERVSITGGAPPCNCRARRCYHDVSILAVKSVHHLHSVLSPRSLVERVCAPHASTTTLL